ncbi:MAG TPA: glycosyltransferase family 2 protein [Stellaceae bacterium]|nr:glycosyltransferase family 2 protein [Stellaceae bacterium]
MERIAAVLACHDRKAETLSCLASLRRQRREGRFALSVFLVDDGSSDGTGEAVRAAFPEVAIIRGAGDLFWAGAMRVGLAAALARGFDLYLMLNDDVVLEDSAVLRLLDCRRRLARPEALIAGAMRDPETGRASYGGLRYPRLGIGLRLVPPRAAAQPCDSANGNCLLVPAAALARLGNIDPAFTHQLGDIDLGLRARAAGIGVWLAPGFAGSCAAHRPRPPAERRLGAVLAALRTPKGAEIGGVVLHPFGEWLAFVRRHFPRAWPIYFLLPYRRLLGYGLTRVLPRRRTPRRAIP